MHHQWLSLHNLDFTSQPLKYHFLWTYHFYLCLDIYVSTNLPNHFPWGQLFFQLVHGAFAISFHDWTLLPSMPLFFFFLFPPISHSRSAKQLIVLCNTQLPFIGLFLPCFFSWLILPSLHFSGELSLFFCRPLLDTTFMFMSNLITLLCVLRKLSAAVVVSISCTF